MGFFFYFVIFFKIYQLICCLHALLHFFGLPSNTHHSKRSREWDLGLGCESFFVTVPGADTRDNRSCILWIGFGMRERIFETIFPMRFCRYKFARINFVPIVEIIEGFVHKDRAEMGKWRNGGRSMKYRRRNKITCLRM